MVLPEGEGRTGTDDGRQFGPHIAEINRNATSPMLISNVGGDLSENLAQRAPMVENISVRRYKFRKTALPPLHCQLSALKPVC